MKKWFYGQLNLDSNPGLLSMKPAFFPLSHRCGNVLVDSFIYSRSIC